MYDALVRDKNDAIRKRQPAAGPWPCTSMLTQALDLGETIPPFSFKDRRHALIVRAGIARSIFRLLKIHSRFTTSLTQNSELRLRFSCAGCWSHIETVPSWSYMEQHPMIDHGLMHDIQRLSTVLHKIHYKCRHWKDACSIVSASTAQMVIPMSFSSQYFLIALLAGTSATLAVAPQGREAASTITLKRQIARSSTNNVTAFFVRCCVKQCL